MLHYAVLSTLPSFAHAQKTFPSGCCPYPTPGGRVRNRWAMMGIAGPCTVFAGVLFSSAVYEAWRYPQIEISGCQVDFGLFPQENEHLWDGGVALAMYLPISLCFPCD